MKLYRTPCGILTYYDRRKRHDWVVTEPDGTTTHYGEDYAGACARGLAVPGCQLSLWLDGAPLRRV